MDNVQCTNPQRDHRLYEKLCNARYPRETLTPDRTTARGPCRSRVFVVAAAVAARRRRRRCRRRRRHRRRRRRRVRRRRRRARVRRRSAPKLAGVITMFLTLMDFDDAASESWSCSSVHAQVVGYSYISRDIT